MIFPRRLLPGSALGIAFLAACSDGGADDSNTATGGANAVTTTATSGGTAAGTATTGETAAGSGGSTGTTVSNGSCQESSCGSHKWACWKIPTPISENLAHPQSFTDRGDGTVLDNVTCLTWEQSPSSTVTNWQGQYDRCAALNSSTLGGYADWRLPTRMEMASLTDIAQAQFPDIFTTPQGYHATGSWWYKTILVNDASQVNMAWGYGTNGFTSNALVMSDVNVVSRCVRGNGAGEAYNEYAVQPSNHYTIGTDAVLDNYTSLMWQRGSSSTTLSHAEAETYCAGLVLDGYDDWRLPALVELASTVNEALVGSAIDPTAFPNNPNGCKGPEYWFWAAEAYGSYFWGLSYCDGFTGYNAGADSSKWNYFPTAKTRCVRQASS